MTFINLGHGVAAGTDYMPCYLGAKNKIIGVLMKTDNETNFWPLGCSVSKQTIFILLYRPKPRLINSKYTRGGREG